MNELLRTLSWVLVAILILIPQADASAAENTCAVPSINTPQEAIDAFDHLLELGCLGAEQCTSRGCDWVAKLEQSRPGADVTDEQRRAQFIDRIFLVLQQLNSLAIETSGDQTKLGAAELRRMLQRWEMPTLGATREAGIVRLNQSNVIEWQGSSFDLFLDSPYELDIHDQFQCEDQVNCTPTHWCETPARCDANFKSVIAVYGISNLIYRTLNQAVVNQIDDVGTMLKKYDARWTAFHTKSLAVFPWELAVNNVGYKSARQGFSGPPNYQWLLMHPTIAVAYDSSREDKMEQAILLDVIGRYGWTWGGADGAQITKPFGVALAMSWAGDEPGYGVAVHLPRNWAIGVTRNRDDQTQVLLSVEFGQYVTDKQKNVEDIRKKLEDLKLKDWMDSK